jgi:hypothetical protein
MLVPAKAWSRWGSDVFRAFSSEQLRRDLTEALTGLQLADEDWSRLGHTPALVLARASDSDTLCRGL